MNSDEKTGWVGMSIGAVIMFLPFITPGIFYGGVIEIFIISILALCIFILGAAKALPEILVSVFGHSTNQIKDRTSKLPVNENAQRSRS